MDERMNLSGLGLDHPVIILGKAGLWDGTRTVASIVAFDNIGDIIADSPWNGMEYETWGIDEHDDLRYSGVHHDGVNTCTETAQGKPSPRPANPQGIRHTHAREKTRESLKENQEYHNSVI